MLVTSKVTDSEKRQAIQDDLLSLGRMIAGEWAKPNSCRKIDSDRLRAWGNRMKAAAERDSGNGAEIQNEINSITRSARQLIAGASG
jgi:hypothetical protein